MALTEIDSFTVDHPGNDKRTVRFLWGDLTQMAPADAVDVLVVSCLPDDYTPTPGTLVGALSKAGISVAALARNKAADYRPRLPCWVSQPVTGAGTGIQFKRILVFEPADPVADAVASVWAIFQALACFHPSGPVRVAMPLVCTGARTADPAEALSALTWAAAHYGSSNARQLPTVNVVALTQELGNRLHPTFAGIKDDYGNVFDLKLPNDYGTFVKQAKDRIKTLPPSVTYRQAVAVCIYTTNYYPAINAVLRTKKPTDPDYRQMFPLVEAIDSGLWNMKAHAEKTARGDNMSQTRIDQHQVGAHIPDISYTSTSTDWSVAKGFAKNALTEFDGRTGTEVWDYSVYPTEYEVLFRRDFTYAVDSRSKDAKDFWTFTVHELLTNWCGGSHDA
ncbi:ADP-ribosyltransferase [Kitasatospora sp. NPDC087314]|uniref:ADP-ribosyltransferase n=1 Tax=Kitasatospora sp. NPDC087314 TaxID=3364068 RepID=UPI00382FECE4